MVPVPPNVPIFVVGTCTTEIQGQGLQGVGHTSLVSARGPTTAFLKWAGLNSHAANTTSFGISAAQGTKIISLDVSGFVRIEVNDATSFRVKNDAASGARNTGTVTVTY